MSPAHGGIGLIDVVVVAAACLLVVLVCCWRSSRGSS